MLEVGTLIPTVQGNLQEVGKLEPSTYMFSNFGVSSFKKTRDVTLHSYVIVYPESGAPIILSNDHRQIVYTEQGFVVKAAEDLNPNDFIIQKPGILLGFVSPAMMGSMWFNTYRFNDTAEHFHILSSLRTVLGLVESHRRDLFYELPEGLAILFASVLSTLGFGVSCIREELSGTITLTIHYIPERFSKLDLVKGELPSKYTNQLSDDAMANETLIKYLNHNCTLSPVVHVEEGKVPRKFIDVLNTEDSVFYTSFGLTHNHSNS